MREEICERGEDRTPLTPWRHGCKMWLARGPLKILLHVLRGCQKPVSCHLAAHPTVVRAWLVGPCGTTAEPCSCRLERDGQCDSRHLVEHMSLIETTC